MFIPEFMIFRAMVTGGQWLVLVVSVILLTFVIYAMSTRIMHISFSSPRSEGSTGQPDAVNPAETISQFVLLGLVIAACFYQPPFLVDMISRSIAIFPK